MSESPYAIPVDDLLAGVHVPQAEQVEMRAEPRQPEPAWSAEFLRHADGGGGDADGD